MPPAHYHRGKFPPTNLNWAKIVPYIGPANAAVARYEGMLVGVPNANVLLAPLTTQEAVLSSRIEGTQATMGEVLEFEATGGTFENATSKVADIQEVLNYRSALHQAMRDMASLPLSERVIRNAHRVLMTGVRGSAKSPGAYRRTPVWIGPEGAPIDAAWFVPAAAGAIDAAMSTLERYMHAEAEDALVQLAIIHAEFEAIHPFLDGNGRMGRLLVPLFLVHKSLLALPNFYISAYLEANRDEYYQRLREVSRSDDWTGWCIFFLKAVRSQAEANCRRVSAIFDLYRRDKLRVHDVLNSKFSMQVLDWIVARPIFRASDFTASGMMGDTTSKRFLRELRSEGILKELQTPSGRRSSTLCYPELLNLAEGKEVF